MSDHNRPGNPFPSARYTIVFQGVPAGNSQESKEPIEFQTERYSLQEKAIAVIAERNLGPAEDIQKLSDTMDTTTCSRRTTS